MVNVKKGFKRIGDKVADVVDWGSKEWEHHKKYGQEDKIKRLKSEVEIEKLRSQKRKYEQEYEKKVYGGPFDFGMDMNTKKKKKGDDWL